MKSTITNNQGEELSIVSYEKLRSMYKISVKLPDGTIIKGMKYPKYRTEEYIEECIKHIGETNTSNAGMIMRIIRFTYRNDIDVQFTDGSIAGKMTYTKFLKGEIEHPLGYTNKDCGNESEVKSQDEHEKNKREFTGDLYLNKFETEMLNMIGQKRTNKEGYELKIIDYRSKKDLDVQAETGHVFEGVTYEEFNDGSLITVKNHNGLKSIKERFGETNINRQKLNMKIVGYRNANDIDVKFEDGTIVKGVSYGKFKKGTVYNEAYDIPEDYKKQRLGEEAVNVQGLNCKIIKYKNYYDIDVQFDDGTVVEHARYDKFKFGTICNPNYAKLGLLKKRAKRVGEWNIAVNGMRMEIIEYRSSTDIDIQFEDGAIVKHKSYKHFKEGGIGHPENTRSARTRKERLGKENIATNGMKMKIIEYRGSNDIDIEFEDGTIVKGRTYTEFTRGTVGHPKINAKGSFDYSSRVGEKRLNNSGEEMEIVAYGGSNNIDIRFSDGTVVTRKTYQSFKNGSVRNPSSIKKNKEEIEIPLREEHKLMRIGETNKNSKGRTMEIIDYRKANDIDIEFEDGIIVRNKAYKNFREGKIAHPDDNIKKTINNNNEEYEQESINKEGLHMRIIEFRNYFDVDVEINNEAIVKHRTYEQFIEGNITREEADIITKKKTNKFETIKKEHLREENVALNGMKMKIIAYRRYTDIDIQFEDGTIVRHKGYRDFKKGMVRHPELKTKIIMNKDVRLGEENIASNGLKMRIIKYRRCDDIDIEFEDGTVVEHRSYSNFKKGSIEHPNIRKYKLKNRTKAREKWIGKENIANNGMRMRIIAYRRSNDLDIQFEDGTIVKNKELKSFNKGSIGNPNIKNTEYKGVIERHERIANKKIGEEGVANNGMRMRIIEYRRYKDIDIQFEDGVIVEHKDYAQFKKGRIAHPNIKSGRVNKNSNGIEKIDSNNKDIKTKEEIVKDGRELLDAELKKWQDRISKIVNNENLDYIMDEITSTEFNIIKIVSTAVTNKDVSIPLWNSGKIDEVLDKADLIISEKEGNRI